MSEVSEAGRLSRFDITRLRAPNPGPLTLSGTNSWVIGRSPAWVVDPGPAIEIHVERLVAEVESRGGLGGVAITHDHIDHVEALDALLERCPAPVAAADHDPARPTRPVDTARSAGTARQARAGHADHDVALADGIHFGPLRALSTPGHARDHFAFVTNEVCFTGDAVLGEGSVFIGPDPGALAGYLAALERLRELPLALLCPGHGPPIWQARTWIDGYLEHRLERERRLLDALAEGRRTTPELLDAAWSEVPGELRAAAAVTLQAHLDKLAEEGRLPDDVERAQVWADQSTQA